MTLLFRGVMDWYLSTTPPDWAASRQLPYGTINQPLMKFSTLG